MTARRLLLPEANLKSVVEAEERRSKSVPARFCRLWSSFDVCLVMIICPFGFAYSSSCDVCFSAIPVMPSEKPGCFDGFPTLFVCDMT